ncbi:MAG: HRDC domain-containing protein [Chloroflexi bacterium]|nr:HRDC domain-containing protein [Chloroflexota bacterium]MBU1749173.1 HRDC domain-containing protein [Chloroflexota bacterium]
MHRPVPPTQPPTLVTTPASLSQMMSSLSQARQVALDTEANSFYAYHERVCLIQLTFAGQDYVIDPLIVSDLSALGPVLADPAVEKAFHAAEYDLILLKREYGFEFANLFDTMIASRIVGWPNVGLASVLSEQFDVRLDKRWQRADWGKRPLPPEQLAYARLDTHYLLPLRNVLLARLQELGREQEAREEFARLAQAPPPVNEFDPDGFWRIKGAHDLSPHEAAVLRELYLYRDAQARQRNRPPFKIFSDAAMLRISQTQPSARTDLLRIKGMSQYVVQRYGRGVLQAVKQGLRVAPQRPPRQTNDHRPDDATLARLAALKAWRKNLGKQRGVDPDVVLSNAVLMALARRNPQTEAELSDVPDLGDWKRQEYGAEIVRTLQAAAPARKSTRRRRR